MPSISLPPHRQSHAFSSVVTVLGCEWIFCNYCWPVSKSQKISPLRPTLLGKGWWAKMKQIQMGGETERGRTILPTPIMGLIKNQTAPRAPSLYKSGVLHPSCSFHNKSWNRACLCHIVAPQFNDPPQDAAFLLPMFGLPSSPSPLFSRSHFKQHDYRSGWLLHPRMQRLFF